MKLNINDNFILSLPQERILKKISSKIAKVMKNHKMQVILL